MVIKQAWNPKTKRWVKYDFSLPSGFIPLDVKQRNPTIPFKGVPIHKKKKKK